jgi:serine/threonine-protein kinase
MTAGSHQPAHALLGQVLEGTYRIQRLLGEGGMGAVYEATQVRLNKRVAVKVMARELTANPEALARFRREAEVTSGLGHPHIVQVFDFGATPTGEPFLAMEFLDGEDLEHRLRRDGPLSLPATLHIVTQIAGALAATHAHGVVHRDLKPANIYLLPAAGAADFVKVLDFGISKVRAATTQLTKVETVMGTPNYMSPEQALGRVDEIDDRTDQWALACIAWECLSGAGPFVGGSAPAILFQVVHEAPLPLAEKVPGLPAEVVEVLLRALAKQKNDRYPDVAAFSGALALAGGQMPASTVALPPATRPRAGATELPPTTFTQSAGAVDGPHGHPRSSHPRWKVAVGSATVAVLLLTGALLLRPRSHGTVPGVPASTGQRSGLVAETPAGPQPAPQPAPPAVPQVALVETPPPPTAVDPQEAPTDAPGSATGKQGKRKRGGAPLSKPTTWPAEPRADLPPSQLAPTAPAPAQPPGRENVPKGGDKW